MVGLAKTYKENLIMGITVSKSNLIICTIFRMVPLFSLCSRSAYITYSKVEECVGLNQD